MIKIYTEKEICEFYRKAYDGQDKLSLLEELTLLDRKKIIDILKKNGIHVETNRNSAAKERFLELYNQGLNDRQIARELGKSEGTINTWRSTLGLESNHKKRLREQANKK